MKAKCDVLCIGLTNINVMISPVDKSVFERDVTLVEEIITVPGGDATNEAIVLAHLGVSVRLLAKTGRDAFGRQISAALKENGVETDALIQSRYDSTSVCAVLVNPDKSRNFASFRGANETLGLSDIDFNWIKQAKIVCIGSMFALKGLDGDGVLEILGCCRKEGIITVADMKADTYHLGPQSLTKIYPYLDYFMPSYEEALYLSDKSAPGEMASFFKQSGCRNVIIKLGEKGCYVDTEEFSGMISSFNVNTVDTTGAGDNFVAGFIAGLLFGFSVKSCAIFGNAVAALSVQKIGAITGNSSTEQVLQFLGKERPEWSKGE